MVKKTDLIFALEKFSSAVSKKIHLSALILFGSRAQGHPRKYSDVDLLVVSPDFRGKAFGRTRKLYSLWKIDLPVDFICLTPEEFEEKRGSRLNVIGIAAGKGIRIV